MKTSQEYLQQPYARIVIPVERGGFHAELLEFFGCFAQGETAEEAYNNLEKAAEAWIENALAQGHEIPEPSSAIDYSGRIVLRLPQGIHQQAARFAERDQTSLNTYLVSAVAAKVGAEQFYNALTERFEREMMYGFWSAYYSFSNPQPTGNKTLHSTFEPQATSITLPANAAIIR
jgi:antitoxin HicB